MAFEGNEVASDHCESVGCLSAAEVRYTGHHFYQYLLEICRLALSLSESITVHFERFSFSDLETHTHMDISLGYTAFQIISSIISFPGDLFIMCFIDIWVFSLTIYFNESEDCFHSFSFSSASFSEWSDSQRAELEWCFLSFYCFSFLWSNYVWFVWVISSVDWFLFSSFRGYFGTRLLVSILHIMGTPVIFFQADSEA